MLNEVSDELQHGTKPPQVYQVQLLGLNQIMPMTRDGNPSVISPNWRSSHVSYSLQVPRQRRQEVKEMRDLEFG